MLLLRWFTTSTEAESGHVFLFANARGNRLELLVYDGTGFWVCAKKLDGGEVSLARKRDRCEENHSTIRSLAITS